MLSALTSPPRESGAVPPESQDPEYTVKGKVSRGKSGGPYLILCSFLF